MHSDNFNFSTKLHQFAANFIYDMEFMKWINWYILSPWFIRMRVCILVCVATFWTFELNEEFLQNFIWNWSNSRPAQSLCFVISNNMAGRRNVKMGVIVVYDVMEQILLQKEIRPDVVSAVYLLIWRPQLKTRRR
jgi:hypothetical protein